MIACERRDLLVALLGLGAAPALIAAKPKPSRAAGGLNRLFDDMVHQMLLASPETATSYGLDAGRLAPLKHLLDDRSPAGRIAAKRRVRQQLRRLEAVNERGLSGIDAVNLQALRATWTAKDRLASRFAYGDAAEPRPYVLSHLTGAYASVPSLLDTKHSIQNRADAEAYLDRMRAFATVLRQEVERLQQDAAIGVIPPDFVQDRTLNQLKSLRDQSAEGSGGLVDSFVRKSKEAGLGTNPEAASSIWRSEIVPALTAQVDTLSSLRPKATSDAGVWRLPDGEAYYSAGLQIATTTNSSPDELHRLGLELSRDLGARLRPMLAAQGYRGKSLAEQVVALMSDPKLVYPNDEKGRGQLVSDVTARLAEIERRLPKYFHKLPEVELQIRRVPPFLESGAPFAHYEDPSVDGRRPGIFYLNLRDTSDAPTWMLTTTSFHEALPGHHLQQAVLQEGPPVPLIREIVWSSAYGEGWGLYAEQIADELGMYESDPTGRIGYMIAALLRANRLVADTGIHALRWSRERAVAWVVENGIPRGLAANEVERYSVWPGQACSYMVGKTKWTRLRARAEAALGAKYDIRDFHTAALKVGAVPLTVLEDVVDAYIVAKRRPTKS